jgi:hypothetical protein
VITIVEGNSMSDLVITKRISIEAKTIDDVANWLNSLEDADNDHELTEPVTLEIEIDMSPDSGDDSEDEGDDTDEEEGVGVSQSG